MSRQVGLVTDPPQPDQHALLAAVTPLVQERIQTLSEAVGLVAFLFTADEALQVEESARLGPDALEDGTDFSRLISFLPGLKSAGGTEEILRNTVGERVLGLPPEPRLDKGIPFSELRAKEREAAGASR